MAKDWIKMRIDLSSHPKVVRILSATKSDKFRVVGGLHAVWCIFDAHSNDGELKGYTPETMDHIVGWDGLSKAMIDVGWLEYDGAETLVMPDFDTHNGQSAKRRADETERKRRARKSADKLRTGCGQGADKVRSREEKRREDHKDPPCSPPSGESGRQKFGKEYCDNVAKLYNDILGDSLPKVAALSDKRKTRIKRIVKDLGNDGLDAWEDYFSTFKQTARPFYFGSNDRQWQANFDYLLRSDTVIKTLEGAL